MSTQSTMATTNLKLLALESPLLLSAAAFLVIVSFIHFLLNRPRKLDLPVVGSPGETDHREALIEGTAKYPNSPFIIPTAPPLVILPISVLDEVRNLPENKVSLWKDVRRAFSAKHTGIGTEGPELIQSIKNDLTRHIASTLDDLQDEVRYGFDKELESCEDWTPIPVHAKMARIVALLSGRIFVGRPLSREEEWIQASITFTFSCTQARLAITAYHEWSRGIVAYFLPEIKKVKEFKKRGAQLLQPIVDAQLSKEGNDKIRRDDSKDEQGTFISWLLKNTKEKERSDPLVLANNQMALSLAAIHTTTMATTAAIYDLAAHPEHIQPLRDEIEQVVNEDGNDVDGVGFKKLKKSSMPKLWKLDSFLKESQRFTPVQLPTNVRVTTSPVTLSTGYTLPTGTRFGFAAWAIMNDPQNPIFSPSLQPTTSPPSQFDGLRFYKLRKIPGNENKHQFVTTSSESLNFGHGNHACPGRFFASNEIKVVLIELLREWEWRFREGEVRPKNLVRSMTCSPDKSAVLEFRRRKAE